jgi:hypothetical protein
MGYFIKLAFILAFSNQCNLGVEKPQRGKILVIQTNPLSIFSPSGAQYGRKSGKRV